MRPPASGPIRSCLARLARPPCAVCGLAAGPVCADCEADYFPPDLPRCEVCAIALAGAARVCGRCITTPPHFHRTTALGDYAPPLDGMVMALKFGVRLELASAFGELLAARVVPPGDALVVAVPLAYERMAERGFNQSLQIARAFCRAARARLDLGLLRRVRHAPPQQSLALEERRRNIRGAYQLTGDARGREVFVVDDVMTSGSTIDEIARVLVAAGAARVHAAVVARTP